MFGSITNLAWWGWILCGLGFALMGRLIVKREGENEAGLWAAIVAMLFYIFAALCTGIGLIQYFKWHAKG